MTEESMDLAVFDPFRALATKVQEEDSALLVDHTTTEGEKELRSWVRTVRGYRAGLEKIRVRAKADALEYGRKVDGLAKELKAPFDTIIDARMKPLDEIEDAKRAAAEAIVEAERVEAERVEAERLPDLKRREDEVARKETEQKAAEEAANAEQREVERVQRETRIAESAAQTARTEAEEKAERERLAAIAAAEAEKDRLAAIERKRITDTAHRENVESEIFDELTTLLEDSQKATDVLLHLKAGYVPHVTINY